MRRHGASISVFRQGSARSSVANLADLELGNFPITRRGCEGHLIVHPGAAEKAQRAQEGTSSWGLVADNTGTGEAVSLPRLVQRC
jgi:hypothetical protein